MTVSHSFSALPGTLRAEIIGSVAVLVLARPQKRNALSDEIILGIEQFFLALDAQVRAVVIDADGDHFCAGLDLAEMAERTRSRASPTRACGTGSSTSSRTGTCRSSPP